MLLGCGGAAAPGQPGAAPPSARRSGSAAGGAVDPLPYLADSPPSPKRGAVLPRAAWLDLGDPAPVSPESEPRDPVEVVIVEPGATLVRVAVRTPVLRYVVWVKREDLMAVLLQEVKVGPPVTSASQRVGATLRAGAHVDVLERKEQRVRIRYSGGVELETWVAAAALAEQGEPLEAGSPIFSGLRLFHASPGLAIRAEPRWASTLLAVLARTYIVEEVRVVDEAWSEVQYADGAVSVRGFASRRDPPQRLHGRATTAPSASALPASGDKLPAGACLYASPQGEAIGLTLAPVPAVIAVTEREGWRSVTIDTPWSPMRFSARREHGTWQPCDAQP